MKYMKIYVSSYDTWDDVNAAAFYYIRDGFYIMSILMVLTILLEMHSFQTARALYQKNASLYRKAWLVNFVNHFGLADKMERANIGDMVGIIKELMSSEHVVTV